MSQSDRLTAVTMMASSRSPSVFPIAYSGRADDHHPLSHPLAAMGQIEAGQAAVLRLDFSADNRFQRSADDWVARARGEKPARGGIGPMALRWTWKAARGIWLGLSGLIYFSRRARWATADPGSRDRQPPVAPWANPAPSEKAPPLNDRTRSAIKLVEEKARAGQHFKACIRAAALGDPGESAQLERIATDTGRGFDGYASQPDGERLAWRKTRKKILDLSLIESRESFEVQLPRGVNDSTSLMDDLYRNVASLSSGKPGGRTKGKLLSVVFLVTRATPEARPLVRTFFECDQAAVAPLKRTLQSVYRSNVSIAPAKDELAQLARRVS